MSVSEEWALPAGEQFPLGFPGPDPADTPVPGSRQRPRRGDENHPDDPHRFGASA